MASKIKGTSTLQLTQLEPDALMKMNEKELRQVVSRMADTANKRVDRFRQRGETSPAYREATKGGKFSTKGLNLNQLRAEYARTKDFLTGQTSTVLGAAKVEKDVIQTLRKNGVEITREQYRDFWRAYERLKERDPSIKINQLKYKVLKEISREMDGDPKSIDDIVEGISSRLSEIYEESQEEYDVSDFFTIE